MSKGSGGLRLRETPEIKALGMLSSFDLAPAFGPSFSQE
jgi:hypothetical protein